MFCSSIIQIVGVDDYHSLPSDFSFSFPQLLQSSFPPLASTTMHALLSSWASKQHVISEPDTRSSVAKLKLNTAKGHPYCLSPPSIP